MQRERRRSKGKERPRDSREMIRQELERIAMERGWTPEEEEEGAGEGEGSTLGVGFGGMERVGSSLTEAEARRLAGLASEGLDVEDLKALKQWDDEAGFGAEGRKAREAKAEARARKKGAAEGGATGEEGGAGIGPGEEADEAEARTVGCWVRLSGVPRKVGAEKNVREALTRYQSARLVELKVVPHAEDREKRPKEQRCSGNVWAGFEDADSGKAFAAAWNAKPMPFGDKAKQLRAEVKYLTGPRPPQEARQPRGEGGGRD